ncbi:DUF6933 domain-containing protein [Piscirickettsia litoralis]|uniref:DUF6933 domain-containing protein n=1 Tax=Piscirickettsia litoralis TaxID=1891921 RepID=A0ABX2ZXU6_9GAMM|nr:hypothetical protein [Piscirickettsia litoralis]ODN41426.1 hypothetical protein BGC07_16825 [Piscirickettsia litoralis]
MPQYRVTQKFAKDLKLKALGSPAETQSIFDDWVIDMIRVGRRKVGMITHVHSFLTFFVPYSEIGGASEIHHATRLFLVNFLYEHGLDQYVRRAEQFFDTDTTVRYCKTDNRKLVGHMTDLKYMAEGQYQGVDFESINWDEINRYVHNTIVRLHGSQYSRPEELFVKTINSIAD